MQQPQPTGIVAPKPPINLSNEAERQRLTPGGLKAFFRITAAWRVTAVQSRQLIGGMSNGKYQDLKRRVESGDAEDIRPLSQDELQRMSYVIGITKALRILHAPALADAWMTLPNTNRMFGGDLPLNYALHGGIPALAEIRRLLDARRGMNA
jgi:hypothetical protein